MFGARQTCDPIFGGQQKDTDMDVEMYRKVGSTPHLDEQHQIALVVPVQCLFSL